MTWCFGCLLLTATFSLCFPNGSRILRVSQIRVTFCSLVGMVMEIRLSAWPSSSIIYAQDCLNYYPWFHMVDLDWSSLSLVSYCFSTFFLQLVVATFSACFVVFSTMPWSTTQLASTDTQPSFFIVAVQKYNPGLNHFVIKHWFDHIVKSTFVDLRCTSYTCWCLFEISLPRILVTITPLES